MYNIYLYCDGKREVFFSTESAEKVLAKMAEIRTELGRLGALISEGIYPMQTIIRFMSNGIACKYTIGMTL